MVKGIDRHLAQRLREESERSKDAPYPAGTHSARQPNPAEAPRREFTRKTQESWASSAGVRASMQSNKPRDTKPELAVRRAVHALGLRYRVNRRPLPRVRRTADLVFTRAKVAVFVDGCFWHGCPQHHTVAVTNARFWADKVAGNRRRDNETDRLLAEAGWDVIRVWEHEPVAEAAQRIAAKVRDRAGRTHSDGPARG